jgi:stage III sporulation protein AH
MKLDNLKTKLTDFCRKVGKRNFIIFGAVLLTVVAVGVNLLIFAGNKDEGHDYSESAGMDAGTVDTSADSGTQKVEDVDSYFSSIAVDRQRTRDEAIEVLQAIVDDASSTEAAKTEASTQISTLASIMEKEANIETLIMAKGFEECVAVISNGNASIVVKSDGLTPAQLAQINEIVYEQASIKPVNVKIIER